MRFSAQKSASLRPAKEKWLSTFFIALITAAVFFVPYIISDHGYFIFFGDFNVQQIPFYRMCHDAVRAGNFGWNWLTDLGANFIGSYSFYLLGSPFFWLTIPFPGEAVPYLMGPLLILKFACAALTAYLYIRRFTRTPEAARLGGILYAFSGFSVYNIFFNHFHEAIIFFPLLLLALELLLTENRHGLFAFCVFLCAGVNYFFFFGMVIFVIIYFVIRVCSGAVKISAGRFLLISFEAVLGLTLSAFILLPSVMCVSQVSRVNNILLGWNAVMYGKEQIYLNIIECFFFPPDLPARPIFFPNADVKWASLGGWLPLFGMTGVIAYCQAKKGSWIKRIICTMSVMALFPFLNSAFYAFNSAYYARWFYMPILIMCLATVMALEDRETDWKSSLKWVTFITLAFTLVIGFFPQRIDGKYVFGLYTQGDDNTYTIRFFTACAIALVSIILIWFMLKTGNKKHRKFYNTCMCIVCCISIIYGAVFIGGGKQHANDTDTVMIPALIEGKIELPDNPENYRVDTYDCLDNTGMYLNVPCINAFHSIVPAGVTDYYNFVGEERGVGSRPETDNFAIRNMLSVRFVLNRLTGNSFEDEDGTTKMPGYKKYGTSGEYAIYENENYVPYGFSYDKYISSTDCEEIAESDRAATMLKAMVLTDEQIAKYGSLFEPFDTTEYFSYDEQEIAEDCAKLKATSAKSFTVTKSGFKAEVMREKDALVFFSVPYDSGFTATVNGQEVQIEKVNIGFMAVPVKAGNSTIEFTYETPGLKLGFLISGGALAIFIIYIFIVLITAKRRKNAVYEYPEGDALLKQWTSYELADAEKRQTPKPDESAMYSLDNIADSLEKQYPTVKNPEFNGGFTVSDNSNNDSVDK